MKTVGKTKWQIYRAFVCVLYIFLVAVYVHFIATLYLPNTFKDYTDQQSMTTASLVLYWTFAAYSDVLLRFHWK